MNRNVTKTVTHHILPCLGLLIVEAVSCVLAVYGIVILLGYDAPSLILSEEKKWELRKTEPRAMKNGPITLWLYESGKDGAHAIIGKCQTKYALPMLQQLDNWQRLWMMREACITEEYLSSYIPCRAWNLTSPVRLPYAVPLSEIGLARPPQSWQYLTEEQAALLR